VKKAMFKFVSMAIWGCVSIDSAMAQTPWRPDHTVVVVMENLSAYEATPAQRSEGHAPVYGQSNWSYFNQLAAQGAKFTQSHFGRTPYGSKLPTRPSQPNYLLLFSGHHQGVLPAWFVDERSPYQGNALRDRMGRALTVPRSGKVGVANQNIPNRWLPLTSPNLGAAIMKSGGTFASFSESLPYPSRNCGTDSTLVPCEQSWALTDLYRRKHNPAINWTDQIAPTSERGLKGDLANNVLPVSVNLGFDPTQDPVLKKSFRGFAKDEQGKPLGFDRLPTVSLVIPNEQNDAHSNSAEMADGWLRHHLGAYAQWAMTHNSLLIVTFDEDGSTDSRQGDAYQSGTHRIPTIFVGAGVKPGVYDQPIDHLNVLSTVLWLHGALDTFQADFRQFHQVRDGSGSEAELEALNLKPITWVFGKVQP
jgi:hypothetical protein